MTIKLKGFAATTTTNAIAMLVRLSQDLEEGDMTLMRNDPDNLVLAIKGVAYYIPHTRLQGTGAGDRLAVQILCQVHKVDE